MEYDLYIKEGKTISEYAKEKSDISFSNKKITMQYLRLEQAIIEASSIAELGKHYEIKMLCSSTGLRELKLNKIRVIHFMYKDKLLVLLGTFHKKTGPTPPKIIKQNNNRIADYIRIKENSKNEQ